jgi:hypothetical protein
MSKRALKKYVAEMTKEQLEAQLLELYDKFTAVKVYYDFAFNPNENQLIDEAKVKIANEYFPVKSKRPKMRRSVAQQFIKHFKTLGVDSFLLADLMLYTIEIAQTFSAEKPIKQVMFYKSMFLSFHQAVAYLIAQGILSEFHDRVVAVKDNAISQNWYNQYDFEAVVDRLQY